jgi:hypothetical protein
MIPIHSAILFQFILFISQSFHPPKPSSEEYQYPVRPRIVIFPQ